MKIFALGLALALAGPSVAPDAAPVTPEDDIVEVAKAAGSFTTLLTAVEAAGLVDVLKGEGPFTVFAPTDEAFAKIPEADLQALLNDTEALKAVLLYHVVSGAVSAADVMGLTSAETVNGSSVSISAGEGVVMVDGATVITADIEASNGIIHVIDTVIIPEM
ncbi:MAG: fasciclin domain-containing protein [Acidimicrobiia bacterium]|nr:fasciclin domain-containing protein [Acidimicrobiia bacterium]NNF28525.1 fasciclin domain-containing protein [Gemmatimonadota bacterium]